MEKSKLVHQDFRNLFYLTTKKGYGIIKKNKNTFENCTAIVVVNLNIWCAYKR